MSSKINECPFCLHETPILSNKLAYARYDNYPVNKGHLLIIPYRHISSFFDLSVDERHAVFTLIDKAKILLDKEYSPDGYNIGINIGSEAGQTVWHAHIHLIPRYTGDTIDPRGGVRGVIPDRQKY